MSDPLRNPSQLIRRVYSYVAYLIGDGAEAEDITSETFERALRYRDSFDPRRGDPAAWLIGIARRCIADSALKLRPPSEALIQDATEGPEEDVVRRLELRGAMATLDDRDRELLSLRYGADLTAKQIGELLELKTNAVEVALHRALGRLRSALEAEDGERLGSPNVRTPKPGDDPSTSAY
jgi:RNA polymerase sigma-70 factor, ECF subfamily